MLKFYNMSHLVSSSIRSGKYCSMEINLSIKPRLNGEKKPLIPFKLFSITLKTNILNY